MSHHRRIACVAAALASLGVVSQPALARLELNPGPTTTKYVGGSKVVDLRSPDAVDSATRGAVQPAPVVDVVRVGDGGGFDWGDAGIGAGGAAALALLALGGAVGVSHRRRGSALAR